MKSNCETCANTRAPADRLAVLPFWTAWKVWSVTFYDPRKADAHQNSAKCHNKQCVPGISDFCPRISVAIEEIPPSDDIAIRNTQSFDGMDRSSDVHLVFIAGFD